MYIKNDNYYIIHGWMINELKLKGTELTIYAIIYGFSQDGDSKFTGSRQYLAEFTSTNIRTVQNALNSLVKKKFISKNNYLINGVKCCEYKITKGGSEKISLPVKNLHGGSEKISLGGSEKISPNKEYIYKENNNKYNEQFLEFYNLYPVKKEKQKAQTAYLKAIKKASHDEIMQGLNNFIKEIEAKKKRGEALYIKYPATWLNAGCWEDEYEINKQEEFDYENTPWNPYG